MVVVGVVLIAEDMVALLLCNHQQSQDTSIQTDMNKSRIVSGDLAGLGLQESRQMMRIAPVIPLMPWSSNLEKSARAVMDAYSMVGALYLPWMLGVLEEHLGEGYWLLFTQRLPISYKVGDCLYGLMH